jgi:hypothetical protein
MNLADSSQPVFLLGALIVAEDRWQTIDAKLRAAVAALLGTEVRDDFEVHGTDLRNGRRLFEGVEPAKRTALRDAWISIGEEEQLTVIFRAIDKRRFRDWIESQFGNSVRFNPHIAAFPLVARVIDDWLGTRKPLPARRILISDANFEVSRDIEKAVTLLRGSSGVVKLQYVVEKGFFIDSRKSPLLQLCDLFTFYLRRREEEREADSTPA